MDDSGWHPASSVPRAAGKKAKVQHEMDGAAGAGTAVAVATGDSVVVELAVADLQRCRAKEHFRVNGAGVGEAAGVAAIVVAAEALVLAEGAAGELRKRSAGRARVGAFANVPCTGSPAGLPAPALPVTWPQSILRL